jgi:hypothetical protein
MQLPISLNMRLVKELMIRREGFAPPISIADMTIGCLSSMIFKNGARRNGHWEALMGLNIECCRQLPRGGDPHLSRHNRSRR